MVSGFYIPELFPVQVFIDHNEGSGNSMQNCQAPRMRTILNPFSPARLESSVPDDENPVWPGVALDQCCSKHSWVNRHRHFGLSEFSVYMSQAATSMLRDYTGDSCIWCRGSVFVWQCSFISHLVTRSQRANERFNSMDSTWLLGYQNFTVYLQHQLLQDREKYRLTEHWGCFSEETTKLITKAWQP